MYQSSQGLHTTQGHKAIPENCYEEEQGRKGFFGPVSHLIKPQPSTRWTHIEGPLKPQLFDLVKIPQRSGYWAPLLSNSDVALFNVWLDPHGDHERAAFRDADGDLLYFVHKGKGTLLTEYGALPYKTGTYLNIPKCIHHTFVAEEGTQLLVIESFTGAYREPDRGMVGRHAFYDSEALRKPSLELQKNFIHEKNLNIKVIEVKRLEQITKFTYDSSVYDTLGWKGDYWPYSLHIDDMMPLLSARVHLPPSAHSTFVANGFIVCTFLPRPLESDENALKVPFYHQNIDFDEVLFYHDGNFFSRDNLHAGMMSFHPAGFPHGPHPKAVQNIQKKTHTDEVAVMIDTWKPLQAAPSLSNIEIANYWKSWMSPS